MDKIRESSWHWHLWNEEHTESPVWKGAYLTGLWLKMVSKLEDWHIGYCLPGSILGLLAGGKAKQLTTPVKLTPIGEKPKTKHNATHVFERPASLSSVSC